MYAIGPILALLAGIALAAPAQHPNPINLSELPMSTAKGSSNTYDQIYLAPNETTSASITTSSISSTLPTSTAPVVSNSELAGVYVCPDINWGGTCTHRLTPLGSADTSCTQLTGKESSIGPDPGFYCEFYTNSYCRKLESGGSDFLGMNYPGVADLRTTDKGNFNDRFYSYLCFGEEEVRVR